MFGKGALLLTFAMLIDFFQLALGWVAFAVGTGLQAITPVGGAAAGAAAGAYACFSTSGGIIQGIADAAKCGVAGGVFGAAISAFGMPFGVLLGFMFDICISLTLGSGLIFLLALSGMFYPKYAWSGGIFEVMPGFDALPGWTLMVILSILRKKKEEGLLVGKASTNLANMVAPGTIMGTSFKGLKTVAQAKTNRIIASGAASENMHKQARIDTGQRVNTELKNVDGIKPAPTNVPHNLPYVQKAA